MVNVFTYIHRIFLRRQLRFDVLTSFFVLQIITAISIMFYMYSANKETLIDFSDKMMEDLSDTKIDTINNHFKGAQNSVALGSYLINRPQDVDISNKKLVEYMIGTVKQYPYLESVFIGIETGRFMQVKILGEGSTYRSLATKLLPKNATIAVRILDRGENRKEETWYYLNQEGKVLEQEKLPDFEITFDHRVREWYNKSMQMETQIWTDIYIFSTSKLPGVATAHPLQDEKGKYIGAIGADIPLVSLSGILKNNSVKGLAIIVNKKGEVIAHPTERNTAKVVNTAETQLVTLEDLGDKVSFHGYRNFVSTQQHRFIFDYDNRQYIATYKEFDQSFFKNWIFTVITPMDVFIGKVKTTQEKCLLISLSILFLSIFVVALIAHRIAKPINALADQANRITNFDLSEVDEVKSGILEIQKLQSSISRMRHSLSSFGKFVPKALVRKLIDKGIDVKVGGKMKNVTLLFTDIAGFTTISETYPADKLMNHLSDYFDEMTQIIIDQTGTVDKYIGDAIMSFWGAPGNDKDHALHACKAALLCQRRLLDLNRKWGFEKKPILFTRMGLHTGDVIVGNLGSTERLNYTAIGDSVNLAARLEGVNKNYGSCVIISQATYKQIQDYAVVRPLDVVAVKGKNEGIKIFELIALQNTDPLLLPTNEQLKFSEQFARGFTLYLEQRWDEAIEAFKDIQLRYPEDIPCALYIERCEAYKKTPPGADWDGVNHLHSK
jgi:adenylate cyclase